MAARNFAEPRALQRELILIEGSFAPNGSSAVAASSRQGPGWSVARTSTGLFTVTLSDKYKAFISLNASVQLTTFDVTYCQIGVTSLSAKTVQIRTITDDAVTGIGALADIAADAGNRINFSFKLSNTSMLPTLG